MALKTDAGPELSRGTGSSDLANAEMTPSAKVGAIRDRLAANADPDNVVWGEIKPQGATRDDGEFRTPSAAAPSSTTPNPTASPKAEPQWGQIRPEGATRVPD